MAFELVPELIAVLYVIAFTYICLCLCVIWKQCDIPCNFEHMFPPQTKPSTDDKSENIETPKTDNMPSPISTKNPNMNMKKIINSEMFLFLNNPIDINTIFQENNDSNDNEKVYEHFNNAKPIVFEKYHEILDRVKSGKILNIFEILKNLDYSVFTEPILGDHEDKIPEGFYNSYEMKFSIEQFKMNMERQQKVEKIIGSIVDTRKTELNAGHSEKPFDNAMNRIMLDKYEYGNLCEFREFLSEKFRSIENDSEYFAPKSLREFVKEANFEGDKSSDNYTELPRLSKEQLMKFQLPLPRIQEIIAKNYYSYHETVFRMKELDAERCEPTPLKMILENFIVTNDKNMAVVDLQKLNYETKILQDVRKKLSQEFRNLNFDLDKPLTLKQIIENGNYDNNKSIGNHNKLLPQLDSRELLSFKLPLPRIQQVIGSTIDEYKSTIDRIKKEDAWMESNPCSLTLAQLIELGNYEGKKKIENQIREEKPKCEMKYEIDALQKIATKLTTKFKKHVESESNHSPMSLQDFIRVSNFEGLKKIKSKLLPRMSKKELHQIELPLAQMSDLTEKSIPIYRILVDQIKADDKRMMEHPELMTLAQALELSNFEGDKKMSDKISKIKNHKNYYKNPDTENITFEYNTNDPCPLIDSMLKCGEYTNEEIAKQLSALATINQIVFSRTVSVILYNLAINPAIQRKAYEEHCKFPLDNLQGLQYLDGIIYEALRIFPPISFICTKLSKLKSTKVVLESCKYYRRGDLFIFPDEFDPNRFLIENQLNTPIVSGNQFVDKMLVYQIKTFISMILRKYKIRSTLGKERTHNLKIQDYFKNSKVFNIILERI